MVNFETAASQDGFSTYKLSIHEQSAKPLETLLITFILYQRAILKQNHHMPLFL
jgi:hypothetical protein